MIIQVLHCPYCQGSDIVKHGMSCQSSDAFCVNPRRAIKKRQSPVAYCPSQTAYCPPREDGTGEGGETYELEDLAGIYHRDR
jgi:hypothetical protein